MMRDYCTYFDHRYLPQGLAMHRSLEAVNSDFRLWVLCLDEECFDALDRLGHPHIRPIALAAFEAGDTELLRAKQNRSRVEYYFTCTPSWPLFILNHFQEVDLITYVDADLYFFADPAPLFEEMGNHSIAIIGHRFPEGIEVDDAGIYNVGWLSFRRSQEAFDCLNWWRERCLEWCYFRKEDGKYADQKYLDDWPTRFSGVAVLEHKGANLAPWNLTRYSLQLRGGKVWVDEQPLIFYHYHGLKQVGKMTYDFYLNEYRVRAEPLLLRRVYAPYIRVLWETTQVAATLLPNAAREFKRASAPDANDGEKVSALRLCWRALRSLWLRERFLTWHGRIL